MDNENTHFVNDLKPVADLVKYLSQTTSVVRTIHLCETEQRMLQGPLARSMLLDPVPCDGKIRVSVIRLPRIASQADFPANSGALMSERQ
jgi:hypothetical protein